MQKQNLQDRKEKEAIQTRRPLFGEVEELNSSCSAASELLQTETFSLPGILSMLFPTSSRLTRDLGRWDGTRNS